MDNSGYGELGFADDGRFEPVARLPGWTRGLCFHGDTCLCRHLARHPSLPAYAPGSMSTELIRAVHAIDIRTAKVGAA